MKRNLILTAVALVLASGMALGQQKERPNSRAQASTKLQVTQCALKVSGMLCGGCAAAAQQALLKLDGVKAVTIDYQTGSANVEYDSKKTSPEKIVTAFNELGSMIRVGVQQPNAK